MDGVDPALLAKFPNLTTTPAELLKMHLLRDVSDATHQAYTAAVRDVVSAP
jgi:spermidine/putrescine transport system substrate-binding protein